MTHRPRMFLMLQRASSIFSHNLHICRSGHPTSSSFAATHGSQLNVATLLHPVARKSETTHSSRFPPHPSQEYLRS
ncbi:hypothetical protein BC629DRAFT_1105234 [Irpex lacteus]|nr:hypothetical protein BC629DRAFT_1105234 [Irpex lacteus]